jgi:hypothetical protein
MQKIYYKLLVLQITFGAFFIMPLSAQNYTVNSNGDTHAVNAASSAVDAGGLITLRSAMEASTARAGLHNISIPAGVGTTINLTLGQIAAGNAAAGNNITVTGPGKALLTINQTTENRIFSTGSGSITFALNDLTLNYTGPAATGNASGGGGAIIAGGAGANTTLTNVAITNFTIQIGNGGAISASSSLNTHNLTITNCTFTNNKCGGAGGAVSYNGLGVVNITNSTFTGNQTGPLGANTGGDGGALNTTGSGNGGTYTVSNCTFSNNQVLAASAHGGAIINTNGALAVNFCRFTGNTANTATNGNTIAQTGGATVNTINSDNNWWAANTPSANDNVVLAAGGAITSTKWLQLKSTASVSSVCPNGVSTVTASFLSNSAAEAVTTGNISTLIGLPISFTNAVLGTLSAAQTTIQSNGTATVIYTAGATAGAGSVNGVVDNVPNSDALAKASITVLVSPAISTNPSASTACLGLPVSFTGAATNQTALVWQESTDLAFTTPVTLANTGIYSGTTTTTLSIADNSSVDGKYYRLVAANSNGCASANSTGALLTVTNPVLSSNNTVTQSVTASNNLYYAPACGIIAKVVPAGASPVTGNVTSQVWVEGSVPNISGQPFVQRHYQLMPATSASTATGTITLYFSQAEFDNFNADAGSTLNLPTGAGDATGISNLRIAKYDGVSNNGTGLPSSYSSSVVIIDPLDANIIWNATLSRWEVTFDVTGFSGFIVQTDVFVLPVKLLTFSARLNNKTADINWQIANADQSINYTLQHSIDGKSFNAINNQPGSISKTRFNYSDAITKDGIHYYRLQITDRNGKITYSNILLLKSGTTQQALTIYPNPVKKGELLQLSLQNIIANATQIVNNAGQVIYSNKNSMTGSVDITLPAVLKSGVYFIKVYTADNVFIRKIIIE